MIEPELLVDLRRTFRAALEHADPVKARNELLAAGWLDALDADEPVATAIVFRLQGETRHDTAALDDIVTRRVAAHWSDAAGDVAVAYPVAGRRAERSPITHVALPGHRHAVRLLWLAGLDTETLEIIDLDRPLSGPVAAGVDPDLQLVGLHGRPSGRLRRLDHGAAPAVRDEAVAAGRVALAHQMVSGAQAMLDLAVDYAKVRKQFGTPIGAFQAVKHRLAETFVAISAADAATAAAASTGRATAAAMAKVLAGRAAATAGRNCLQVFGGVGFTVEHDFHRYFRRNLVLDRLLGDARTVEGEVGQQVRSGQLTDGIVNLDDPLRVEVLGRPDS